MYHHPPSLPSTLRLASDRSRSIPNHPHLATIQLVAQGPNLAIRRVRLPRPRGLTLSLRPLQATKATRQTTPKRKAQRGRQLSSAARRRQRENVDVRALQECEAGHGRATGDGPGGSVGILRAIPPPAAGLSLTLERVGRGFEDIRPRKGNHIIQLRSRKAKARQEASLKFSRLAAAADAF